MIASVFDDRPCDLGEGPMWHPTRGQLFWFDILGKRLLTRDADGAKDWQFDRYVSAAGWVDEDTLLVATDRDLTLFDIGTGLSQSVVALEADNPTTRSNDGRADPYGGFWIGTMGIAKEPGAGALYRYYKGELRQLEGNITIPNATCFSPDGTRAYFGDTKQKKVWSVVLDSEGWPTGDWELFLDHRETGLNPDGAVIDSEGRFWGAEWGASRVACYDTSGQFVDAAVLPVPQPSCPAFGGAEGSTLFVTTARDELTAEGLSAAPLSGQTFAVEGTATGQKEHRVIL